MTISLKQDLAPVDGYPKFDFKRALPKKPYNGLVLYCGYVGFSLSLLLLYRGHQKKSRKWSIYEMESRTALEPLIHAEHDRAYIREMRKVRDVEIELTRNVKGWKVGHIWEEPIFHNQLGRWIHPSCSELYAFTHPNVLLARTTFHLWWDLFGGNGYDGYDLVK